jgi:uncharacterized protein YjbI with pentapeptide repeats
MKNQIDKTVMASLRDRWQSKEGGLILQRLFEERIELDDLQAGMAAVKKNFDVVDLRGIDFSGKDLSRNFLLFELDLSYSTFADSKIQGSFQSAVMKDCIFESAEIISGYFAGADLSGSTFKGAKIEEAEFENANLSGVSFADSRLLNVGFQNVDLTSVDFTGAYFGRVKFGNTRLIKTTDLYEKIYQSETVLNPEGIIWIKQD